jgi:hypothetical protein
MAGKPKAKVKSDLALQLEAAGYEVFPAFYCEACGVVTEGHNGPLYECEEDGPYSKETSGTSRCPECNKQGRKEAAFTCSECDESETVEIEAVKCPCEDLIGIEVDKFLEHMEQDHATMVVLPDLSEVKEKAKSKSKVTTKSKVSGGASTSGGEKGIWETEIFDPNGTLSVVQFKSNDEKAAKYRAYRIARDLGKGWKAGDLRQVS